MPQRIPREYHQHRYLQEITQFQEQPKGPQKWPRLLTSFLDWQRVPKIWEANQICYKRMLQRHPTTNHFCNQENSAINLQRSCVHHSTKNGRISMCAAV